MMIVKLKVEVSSFRSRLEMISEFVTSMSLEVFKKNFMTLFCGWSSTVSRLQSHYEEAVYFLPLSSQKFQVLI